MPAVTIAAIDTIQLRIPLDTWAPPPLFAGRPRTHVEALYVRGHAAATASSAGASPSARSGTAVVAAFDNWIRHLAVGQDPTDADADCRGSSACCTGSAAPAR